MQSEPNGRLPNAEPSNIAGKAACRARTTPAGALRDDSLSYKQHPYPAMHGKNAKPG